MIFSSIPVYWIFISWRSKPRWFQESVGKSDTISNQLNSNKIQAQAQRSTEKNLHKHTQFFAQQIKLKFLNFVGGFTKLLQKIMMVVRPKISLSKVFICFHFNFNFYLS